VTGNTVHKSCINIQFILFQTESTCTSKRKESPSRFVHTYTSGTLLCVTRNGKLAPKIRKFVILFN